MIVENAFPTEPSKDHLSLADMAGFESQGGLSVMTRIMKTRNIIGVFRG